MSPVLRIRAASFADNLGTGAVGGALAVSMAPTQGLAALGGVLSLRVIAAVCFGAWSSRSGSRHGAYGPVPFVVASVCMTLTSLWTVLATVSGSAPVLVGSGYLLFAFSNALMSLHLSTRSPGDAMSLGPIGILGISVGSSLVAAAAGLGSPAVLLVGAALCAVQLLEIPLAAKLPSQQHEARQSMRWGWTALAALLAFSVYTPLALAAGITARYLSPKWVAPALLVYSLTALLAPVLHRRRNHRIHHPALLGAAAVVSNLSLLTLLLGPVPFLVSRALTSVAVFTLEGSMRLAAFTAGGPIALASVTFGSILGVSAGSVVFGAVSDTFSFATAIVLFAAIAALGTMLVSRRHPTLTA